MTTTQVNMEIYSLHIKAEQLASAHMRKLAKEYLKSHRDIKEIVVGNGTYYLKDINNNIIYPHHESFPIHKFFSKWNSFIKVTGNTSKPVAYTLTQLESIS